MNSSKKLKPKTEKKQTPNEKKPISKPWLITSLILVAILVGAMLFDQLYEPVLMTIDGKKYRMSNLSYYFYSVESDINSYAQLLGSDYWDKTYDEKGGITMRDAARQNAVDTSLRTEILNSEAVKQGYKLTDDEKKTVSTKVKSIMDGKVSKDVIKKNHFTNSYLTNILSKIALVSRYREDLIKAQNIDEAAIKEGISYEDYHQYKVEYLYASTQTTDSSGKKTAMSDADKKAAYDKLSAIYDKAKSTDDWSTLLPDDEKVLTYQVASFVDNDHDTSSFSDDFKTMMKKMANGDISQIYEDSTGYYIVRMKDNKAMERYNSAVEASITSAKNTAFDKVYDKIKAKHSYKLNNRAIKSVKMGTFTVAE